MTIMQTHITIVDTNKLSFRCRSDVIDLCSRAYEQDLGPLFCTFDNATHVLAYHDDVLIDHALWVTRWLQCDTNPMLCYAPHMSKQLQPIWTTNSAVSPLGSWKPCRNIFTTLIWAHFYQHRPAFTHDWAGDTGVGRS